MSQLTNEEILQLFAARAEKDGDTFKMRVLRRTEGQNMATSVATLEGATVNHFASPETWLPKLCGGAGPGRSVFLVQGYHTSDNALKMIGQPMAFHVPGEPRAIDPSVMSSPGWVGPSTLIWPDPKEFAPKLPAGAFSIPQLPVAPNPAATSPQTLGSTGPTQQAVSNPEVASQMARLDLERQTLAAERREFERQQHQRQLDDLRKENLQAIREMEARLSKPAAPPPDPVATMLPIMQFMMQQQAEATKQQMAMMTTLLERRADDSPNLKLGTQLADSFGSMMKVVTESLSMATDAIHGPKEPTGLMIVRELAKGVSAIAATSAAKAPAPIPRPQRQPQLRAVPGQQPVPQQQLPVQPAPVPQVAEQVPAPAVEARRVTVVDRIEAMIRGMVDPAATASAFVAAIEDPDLNDALEAVGRDPVTLFQSRLAGWVEEDQINRGAYLAQLAAQLQAQLEAAGGLEDEPEQPEEAELVTG